MTGKVSLLLVDDRPEGLVTLEAVLNNPDYTLIKAGSGKEALAQVLAHDFAAILMDVQMPEMDGFETASIIKQRERSKNIPIIFLTAINKADHFVSTGYSVGAVDYMFKPFDPHILKSKVAVFVDLHRKTRLLQEQSEVLREIEARERMRTLQELESEGRRRYQNLADAIPQIVFRAGKGGDVEYFNQFWQQFTGLPAKSSVGSVWREAVAPTDLALIDFQWGESQKNLTGFECECRLRHGPTGEYRWHLLRVVPEFNAASNLLCWIGVASDIHDQRQVLEELRKAKVMAEAANETKSRFLANMSHEIRTPLGAILGFSEILGQMETTPSERVEAIATIRRNGEQLSKIINDILDLSKVEAGKLEMDCSRVPLLEVVRDVRAVQSVVASAKGLQLHFEIDGEIPVEIETDPTRLRQVMINVIGNAIKFSPAGRVGVTFGFVPATEDDSSRLKICVEDSGPGLTAEQIDDLFQPFTQVDTSMTRKYGGTGLGLAISRRLARALGGDIRVKASRPGEGCRFEISIATGDVSGVPKVRQFVFDAEPSTEPKKTQTRALEGVEVLLVEDSLDNQVLIKRFLTAAGAHVEIANNGREGVDKALSASHDIVLMDIQMPELDGYDAIALLRKSGFETPIVALTAHSMLEERQRCLQLGSNEHLTKPINRAALIDCVENLTRPNRPLGDVAAFEGA